jgi:hypothetical protein
MYNVRSPESKPKLAPNRYTREENGCPKPRPVGEYRNNPPGALENTLCYAIMPPGRKLGFRGGFRPDSNRETKNIGSPAGRRPAGGQILMLSRLASGRNPARKTDFRRGGTIA